MEIVALNSYKSLSLELSKELRIDTVNIYLQFLIRIIMNEGINADLVQLVNHSETQDIVKI